MALIVVELDLALFFDRLGRSNMRPCVVEKKCCCKISYSRRCVFMESDEFVSRHSFFEINVVHETTLIADGEADRL